MYSLFLDCGLPGPKMRMDALVSGEEDSPVYKLLAEAVRSLVPTLEKLNIASPSQVQIHDLADRMYELVGAWAKKPHLHKMTKKN